MSAQQTSETGLMIEDVEGSLASLIDEVSISDEVRRSVDNASVIVYPMVGFRDTGHTVFPVGTDDVFAFLREHLPADIPVEACINDEDYVELSMHADLKRLGIIIVSVVVAPLLLNLLGNYIYDKMKEQPSGKMDVSFSIIITDDGKNLKKRFNYEGPAKDFEIIADEIRSILGEKDD